MADTYTQEEYAEWPYANPAGRRGTGNGLWLTNALFLERATKEDYAPDFTLQDEAVWHEPSQAWLPSARMIYLYSKSEYDAMRKLVGNAAQWNNMKKLAWFRELLGDWQAEWYMRQEHEARALMKMHAVDNAATAKALFEDAKRQGKGAGRPAKRKEQAPQEPERAAGDGARILALRPRS